MQPEQVKCPLCRHEGAYRTTPPGAHRAALYSCGQCLPGYAIWGSDETTCLRDDAERPKWSPDKIRTLLYERYLKKLPRAVLQFTTATYAEIHDHVPVYVPDLLAEWPNTVSEKLRRGLSNLALRSFYLGAEIELNFNPYIRFPLFADNDNEQEYLLNAMLKLGWITSRKKDDWFSHVCVTPVGWAKIEEQVQTRQSRHNPVFVAMWFGGDEQEKMTKLWQDALQAAVTDAGYKVKRADSEEHNEYIMDRIRADIRAAPFVVADLSNQNHGVYYEAGFASGLGLQVVHTCPLAEKQKVHFDIDQINRVLYEDASDLRRKLTLRILGSNIGKGPFAASERVADA